MQFKWSREASRVREGCEVGRGWIDREKRGGSRFWKSAGSEKIVSVGRRESGKNRKSWSSLRVRFWSWICQKRRYTQRWQSQSYVRGHVCEVVSETLEELWAWCLGRCPLRYWNHFGWWQPHPFLFSWLEIMSHLHWGRGPGRLMIRKGVQTRLSSHPRSPWWLLNFLINLAMPRGLRDLSSLTKDWTLAMAGRALNPNHQAIRELPAWCFFFNWQHWNRTLPSRKHVSIEIFYCMNFRQSLNVFSNPNSLETDYIGLHRVTNVFQIILKSYFNNTLLVSET